MRFPVIPSLSPLSDELGVAGRPVPVPPPSSFKPIVGEPRNIVYHTTNYVRLHGNTAAKEAGLRYEEKVQRSLQLIFPSYDATPVVSFDDDSGFRMAKPDGILHLPTRKVVFEIKLQHMPEAYWQLAKLYQPLLQARCFYPVQVVEICQTFDAAMPFPCEFRLVGSVREAIELAPTIFAVVPWKL